MSSSDKQVYCNQLLTRYLLGSLSEEETERLDELSITDGEFARRLEAVENDLVDAYVRGELSGNEQEQFKSFYLSSPKRREKTRFAETFLVFEERAAAAQAIDAPTPVPARPEPGKKSLQWFSRWPFLAAPRLGLQWGFAVAALLILIASGYLLFENLRLRNQTTQPQAEGTAPQPREQRLQGQLAQQRSADAKTGKALGREPPAQREQQLAANEQIGKTGPPSRQFNTVSFVLLPQTRGPGRIATIAVPPGTDRVAIQLELEADDFSEYQVALKNPEINQILWRSAKLKARSGGANKAVWINLSASLLKPQNYTLEMTGINGSGAAELISSYPFRVVTQ